jgi:hypothetical protein
MSTEDSSTAEGKTEETSPWAERLRIASAVGKLALGGTFAATNIGLGALVGIITALPTLTLGTVGAAAGIAASAYTGLNTSLDALKDLAAVVE